MGNLREIVKAFAVLSLCCVPAIATAKETMVVVVETLGFRLPSNTQIEPGGDPVDWTSLDSLSALMSDGTITVLPGRGVELEIGISENSDYATSINNLTALEWLTFQTQMNRIIGPFTTKESKLRIS